MVVLVLAVLNIAGCGTPASPPSRPAEPAPPRELLNHIVERYWDEDAALNPWYSWGGAETRFGEAPADAISPQAMADSLAIERRYLGEALAVSRASLDGGSKITYDIFRRERELAIESFTYPTELVPINPYYGTPQRFALLATAAERYALSSARDFDNWQTRALSYERWTTQAIANMREGMRRGYTLPRVLVERMIPLLAALGEDSPSNVFYQPLQARPGDPAEMQRTPLALALSGAVRAKILPSYRLLHDFLQREYLPRSRESIGLSALPLGASWYAYLVKRATDGGASAAQLHALGMAEVERVHGRIQALLADTASAGNARNFFDDMRRDPRFSYSDAGELLIAYRDLKSQVAALAPALFAIAPRADFEIRRVEGFRQKTSPALSYRRATAYGKIPAVLYVNTADLEARPATAVAAQFLREAMPGHHYQLALQQERADLPRFRRFGGAPAFIAGWSLYAASLGEELGLYRDPESKFGFLLAQLDCAAGMVIDTGLHSEGWTRRHAIDYLRAQSPVDETAATDAVDRVLSLPAETLACSVGFSRIQGLRTRAQEILGPRFDVRGFHTEVLKDGAVPLDVLDAKIKQWLETASKSD